MSDIWAPVVAALGSSLLTALATFGIAWWQARKTAKSALAERRSQAYAKILTQSITIMNLANTMHHSMEVRSGIREALNMTIGKYEALDPFKLADRIEKDLQPLYEAWSEVWAVGSSHG